MFNIILCKDLEFYEKVYFIVPLFHVIVFFCIFAIIKFIIEMQTNPELHMAWQFIQNTGTHLFLTGKAGTGKTTFLRTLKERSPKRMVVLAPTGIAAINAGGVTIHSFFQLPFAPFVPSATFKTNMQYRFGREKIKIIRTMDLLVIDEISMVRADLLDAVDSMLRRYRERDKPFGGVQMLMIGDMQQLAPVVRDEEWSILKQYYDSPYFFSSNSLKITQYATIELKTVYRQQDGRFLALLNKVRENKADDAVLAELNKRYIPGFVPPKGEDYISLTTHNIQAQRINDKELDLLTTKAYKFRAEIKDNFPEYSYPTEEVLTVKQGAQVMFVKNDSSSEKRYYNGMIGEVTSVDSQHLCVCNKTDKEAFALEPEEWTNVKYVLNKETQEITEEVEGTFKQYPIRLAWAVTIHKSQGLTFEHAIIDVQRSFAHGQTYVALSRCKTLEGMVLSTPLSHSSIICDKMVDAFNKDCEEHEPDENTLKTLEYEYVLQIIKELFSIQNVSIAFGKMFRLIDAHFGKRYPKLLGEYKTKAPLLQQLIHVAQNFEIQYSKMLAEANGDVSNPSIQERIHSASAYFSEQLTSFISLCNLSVLTTENKILRPQVKECKQTLDEMLKFKHKILTYESMEDTVFSVPDYMNVKARILLGTMDDTKLTKVKKQKEKSLKVDTKQVSYDMYCRGMKIADIARERGFVVTTIAMHLAYYVKCGKLDATKFVSQLKIDEVAKYLKANPDNAVTLSLIKENVNENITYSDIKFILAAIEM